MNTNMDAFLECGNEFEAWIDGSTLAGFGHEMFGIALGKRVPLKCIWTSHEVHMYTEVM